jgi:putative transposase
MCLGTVEVGAAGDNAAMESFSALLQKNVPNQHRWTTRQDLQLAVVVWIERTYRHRRPQDRLGGLTPIEFETQLNHTEAIAAQTTTVTKTCISPKFASARSGRGH